ARRPAARHESAGRADDRIDHLHRHPDDDPDPGADHEVAGSQAGIAGGTRNWFVGWAKPPDANASRGVPTITRVADPMVGTSLRAFAHPTVRYPTLAARRSDCGGWPKARMKAR